MFDVTLSDVEFKKDFVNQQAEWLRQMYRTEPDLVVDGLKQSLLSQLLTALRLV